MYIRWAPPPPPNALHVAYRRKSGCRPVFESHWGEYSYILNTNNAQKMSIGVWIACVMMMHFYIAGCERGFYFSCLTVLVAHFALDLRMVIWWIFVFRSYQFAATIWRHNTYTRVGHTAYWVDVRFLIFRCRHFTVRLPYLNINTKFNKFITIEILLEKWM